MLQNDSALKQYPVTATLAAVCLVMFALCEITGGSEDTGVLLKWGALYSPVTAENAWRLLTSVFLHAGIRHLLNNLLLLCVLGSRVEKLTGSLRCLIIFLGSAVLANIAAFYYYGLTGQNPVLVGASGGIFGLMGALIWIIIRNKGKTEGLTVKSMLIMVALALYFGFTSAGTANAAHVFGVIFGFVLAALFYRRKL